MGPVVAFTPMLRSGRPTMRGISTEAIADTYWLDDNPEDDYGLTRHELLIVLWFEATHGRPRFRRRWKTWAEGIGWPVVDFNPDLVVLPPTRYDTERLSGNRV